MPKFYILNLNKKKYTHCKFFQKYNIGRFAVFIYLKWLKKELRPFYKTHIEYSNGSHYWFWTHSLITLNLFQQCPTHEYEIYSIVLLQGGFSLPCHYLSPQNRQLFLLVNRIKPVFTAAGNFFGDPLERL